MKVALVFLIGISFAGCLTETSGKDRPNEGGSDSGGEPRQFVFGSALQINAAHGEGFEPSVRIAPDGTIYVAAARGFFAGAEGSLASPIWYSQDNGSTWTPLASPVNVRDKEKSIEGDLAVDGQGNVYFLDTYGPDSVLTVWGPNQVMRSTRPVHGTLVVDDRPWLAAQGDGILYAVVNGIAPTPAPNTVPAGARYWFFRSIDGGLTWSPGYGFPDSGYCHVAASSLDDVTIVVACIGPGIGAVGRSPFVESYVSVDRGTTWTKSTVATNPDNPGESFPAVSIDGLGRAGITWLTNTGALGVAIQNGTTWNVQEIIPADMVASPWIAGGPRGEWAVASYAQGEKGWRVDAWLQDAHGWLHEVVHPEPVSKTNAPRDFFQTAFDRQGFLNIVFQDDTGPASPVPLKPYQQPILFVRQQGADSLKPASGVAHL